MKIIQSVWFKKSLKKLHPNQKEDLDRAILMIIEDPYIGVTKTADLAGIRVHKFKMNKQLTLLAYSYNCHEIVLTLLQVGSHQNFYDELKRNQ
jgi:mRNA-degrading endonuclease YafQ of YafQ-DinJ toxin-antitoxin module